MKIPRIVSLVGCIVSSCAGQPAAQPGTTGAVIYSTFFGGSSYEFVDDLLMDADGCIYVAGHTYSDDFPSPPDVPRPKSPFIFVIKLNPQETTPEFVTLRNLGTA